MQQHGRFPLAQRTRAASASASKGSHYGRTPSQPASQPATQAHEWSAIISPQAGKLPTRLEPPWLPRRYQQPADRCGQSQSTLLSCLDLRRWRAMLPTAGRQEGHDRKLGGRCGSPTCIPHDSPIAALRLASQHSPMKRAGQRQRWLTLMRRTHAGQLRMQ